MIGILLQIVTTIVGASAVWIVGRKEHWYKWGYVVGCVSQISWTMLFLHYGQYFMLPQIGLYGYCWYVGLRRHWR